MTVWSIFTGDQSGTPLSEPLSRSTPRNSISPDWYTRKSFSSVAANPTIGFAGWRDPAPTSTMVLVASAPISRPWVNVSGRRPGAELRVLSKVVSP